VYIVVIHIINSMHQFKIIKTPLCALPCYRTGSE